MRRNLTAAAGLSIAGGMCSTAVTDGTAGTPSMMRRNTSASTLSELRRREQLSSAAVMQGSCAAVVEAVACKLLELVVGKEAALVAMREGNQPSIPEEGSSNSGSSSSGSNGGGSSSGGKGAPEGAASGTPIPPAISASLQGYIHTIVRHLELPNSCIVAALIYVLRAVSGSRFSLSLTNWQPCLLAAFVIAAKLSFDEPVWNEDFVKALRISNVQVHTHAHAAAVI